MKKEYKEIAIVGGIIAAISGLALWLNSNNTGGTGGGGSTGTGYEIKDLSMISKCGLIRVQGYAYYNGQPLSGSNTVGVQYAAFYTPSSPGNTDTDSSGHFYAELPTASSGNTIYVWIWANGKQHAITKQFVASQGCV